MKPTLLAGGLALAAAVSLPLAPALAGDPRPSHRTSARDESGGVLPAEAEPRGLSLEAAARATADFNAGPHTGPAPDLPVQMLYTTSTNTFTVKRGTFFYVPVLQNDNSYPVIGQFPNVDDRKALVRYTYSAEQFGVQYTRIAIDGKETTLGKDYLVGIRTNPPLSDGATQYSVVAAFIGPLKPGVHKVTISASATGKALVPWCQIVQFCTDSFSFSFDYTVIVN